VRETCTGVQNVIAVADTPHRDRSLHTFASFVVHHPKEKEKRKGERKRGKEEKDRSNGEGMAPNPADGPRWREVDLTSFSEGC